VDTALKLISVFAIGVLELWGAIPAGFAFQLHPILIATASALGSTASAVLVILLGDSLRTWILRHRGGKAGKHSGRVRRIWDKYGVIGLGLLSPLITGAPLGAALGVSFGASPRRLLLWMVVGIVVWSAILTTAGALGIAQFEAAK
jgi:hypothetical protein